MISQLFRVRVDFYYSVKRNQTLTNRNIAKLDDEILAITRDADHSEVFGGNPACGPYLLAEYTTLEKAKFVEAKLIAHLKQYKALP
jgi:hypothetical protein